MSIRYVVALICTLSFVHNYSCELVLDSDTLYFCIVIKINNAVPV